MSHQTNENVAITDILMMRNLFLVTLFFSLNVSSTEPDLINMLDNAAIKFEFMEKNEDFLIYTSGLDIKKSVIGGDFIDHHPMEALEQIQSEHGVVKSDCHLFINFAYRLLNFPDIKGFQIMNIPYLNAFESRKFEVGCIKPASEEVSSHLFVKDYINKAQWVIWNKDGYIGLTGGKGIVKLSKEKWIEKMKRCVLEEQANQYPEDEKIQKFNEEGKLDEWEFESNITEYDRKIKMLTMTKSELEIEYQRDRMKLRRQIDDEQTKRSLKAKS